MLLVNNNLIIIENKANNVTMINITMPSGGVCVSNPNENYQMSLLLTCDSNVESLLIDKVNSFDSSSCSNILQARTKHACPKFNYYSVWNKIIENKVLIGVIAIIIGIFFCFVGRKFLFITEIILGALLVVLFSLFLLINNLNVPLLSWEFWVIVVISIVLGALAGWLISKMEWLAPAILGGLLGLCLGFFLYNLCLKYITSNPLIVFWITMSICIVGGIILGIFLSTHILIIATAIVGGYLIIRVLLFIYIGCFIYAWKFS